MDTVIRLAGDPGAWAALATLIAMEVVLGLDNLVFIAILSNRIDERRRGLARSLGLSLALVFRLALLASASWAVRLTAPLAMVFGHAFSARDLLLLAGGLFLVWKATTEIHHRVDPEDESEGASEASPLSLGAGLDPDHLDRHRLLRRQHHHGGRHDRPLSDHGRGGGRLGRRDDGRLRSARGVHPPQSDGLDARAELSLDDRHDADGRRLRLSYRKGLYLRGDVLLIAGRGAERLGSAQRQAGDVTLTSLLIFAGVYFAAVATPGPGVAALSRAC